AFLLIAIASGADRVAIVEDVLGIDLQQNAFKLRILIAEIVGHGGIDHDAGIILEAVQVIAIAGADVANTGAETETCQYAVLDLVIAPERKNIIRRPGEFIADGAFRALVDLDPQVGIGSDDADAIVERGVSLKLEAA